MNVCVGVNGTVNLKYLLRSNKALYKYMPLTIDSLLIDLQSVWRWESSSLVHRLSTETKGLT